MDDVWQPVRSRLDPFIITVSCTIFAVLLLAMYLILSMVTLIATGAAGALVLYLLATRRQYTSFTYGRHIPSVMTLAFIALPFVLGLCMALEGYSIWQSPVMATILVGLTTTFWYNMLSLPLTVYSKQREAAESKSMIYPTLSVILPAYNEEKVIARTIESLIETDYPNKEIIVVDDGSKDKTLEIANTYKRIKVLHKANGGKFSALNYGLRFARGEVIVAVDADTIVSRDALKNIVTGLKDETVGAVAGNVRILNRRNWLTWCQTLEMVVAGQIWRRTFDIFGTVNVVPGALGAFKRHVFDRVGTYDGDTVVEDFDQTFKTLKSGLKVQGSSLAIAYSEAPETLHDFYKQRIRWYRGNIQTYVKHSDTLTNPFYGFLYRLNYPFMLISSFFLPIAGFLVIATSTIAVIQGDGFFVLRTILLFVVLQHLLTALAVRIEGEDPKLIAFSTFLIIGYKQIVDIFLIKAALDMLFKRRVSWTRAQRIGLQ